LTNYLGGESVAGGKMKTIGTAYWNSTNTGVTNESGFSVLPGGRRNLDGSFSDVRELAYFWSAAEGVDYIAWTRYLLYNGNNVGRFWNVNDFFSKSVGASVRCLKD
jgi:uncharacterized protein (TIGR02145 family)